MLGEHLGDVAEQPGPVQCLDLDRHDERRGLVVVPLTSMTRWVSMGERSPLAQSDRCTDTPRPR